jgi:hypothetical protein
LIILLEILLFILIYYLYNRNKGQNISKKVKVKIYQRKSKSKYIKGGQTMAQNSSLHTDSTTLNDTTIITSANNKELAKRIKDISQQVLERNYELYKALENK